MAAVKREDADADLLRSTYPKAGHSPSMARACNARGEVTGACLRKQAYIWRREPETDPMMDCIRLKLWCRRKLHDAEEQAVIRECQRRGIHAWSEVYAKLEVAGLRYPVSGRLDNEIWLLNETGDGATAIAADFKHPFGVGGKKVHVNPWDMLQFGLYIRMRGLNYLSFANIISETGHVDNFRVDLAEDGDEIRENLRGTGWRLCQIFTSWWALEQHLERGTLPDCDYKKPNIKSDSSRAMTTGDFWCRSCSWLTRCYQDDAASEPQEVKTK
jgi:hypothetical protein